MKVKFYLSMALAATLGYTTGLAGSAGAPRCQNLREGPTPPCARSPQSAATHSSIAEGSKTAAARRRHFQSRTYARVAGITNGRDIQYPERSP